ncbi:tagaturonate reductase [Algoriphagus sp. CAU 1675]|uniref:tagaturonate reductase n=1 Tax=Algoriphagus sp. CAU 1675 TaxID=3032597 RepID=UPI0023DC0AA3|nr:tagaturonate reductase [Algoriphagus sp. CAU 1675]MDF2159080.1 tagaturonate reductase [Algoriphagus sp. CAU 1675]
MKKLNRSTASKNQEKTRILQFGNGNFLRAFVDWMIDIANEKGVFEGNIHTLQVHSPNKDPNMVAQDNLFHVVEEGLKDGNIYQKSRLITCIQDYSSIYVDYEAYLKLGENQDLRFVISNTTEAGIVFDPDDRDYRQIPKTFPGKLSSLLYHRFYFFKGDPKKGLIFLPCELIENNGIQLRECILDYANLWNLPTEFSNWIRESNYFCNTLVDRIVPGFPKTRISEIQESLGLEDNLVVVAEPFHFWAIEGPELVKKEFPLDQAGLNVSFVEDLQPYRTRKVRILNGAHTALVPFAYLKGLRTVRESVEHAEIGVWLKSLIFEEIIPTLDMPKEELELFAGQVLERFANPFIVHELQSIALNSISKFRVRVLPSLLSYFEKTGKWPEKLTVSFAALILFYRGELHGEKLPLKDNPEILEFFKRTWEIPGREELLAEVLKKQELWGSDLNQLSGLSTSLLHAMENLEKDLAS